MAARTLVANITALAKDTAVTKAAANTPHTAGDYIAAGTVGTTDLGKILLEVVNGTTAGTVTVRAPGNGVDVAGNAQTSPYPSNAVFTQGAVGDLTASWGTVAGTTMLGPFTTDRFEQPDGNLYLDWSTATGVTFYVHQEPFNTI